MSKNFFFAVLFGYAALSNQASAATFDWTANIPLNGGGSITGSGQLVAQDTLSTGYDGIFTGYLVTSITGTYAGEAITSLLGVNAIGGNDNLINTSDKLLDVDGLAFTLAASLPDYGGNQINLYHEGNGYSDNNYHTNFSVSGFTLTQTPIPAAIWMVGSALAGLVGFGRRKLPV